MDKNKKLGQQRERRRFRVRKKLRGTQDRPRLTITRSLAHFGCQLVDDEQGRTLASANTRDKAIRDGISNGGNCAAAAEIGRRIAKLAIDAGFKQVCLDRGHNKYHGRVKAFAEAAREAGLDF